jgi:hypothetical protein
MKAYHFEKDGTAKEGPIPAELDASVRWPAPPWSTRRLAESDDALSLEKVPRRRGSST